MPSPCRAIFSASAGLTDRGACDLEFGGQYALHRDDSSGTFFPTQFDLGLCTFADLRLGWSGHNRLRDADGHCSEGFGDPQVGGQLFFAPQQSLGFDVGMAYWHKIPKRSVSKGISTGRSDDSAVVILTRTQGAWMVDVNLGANWVGSPEGRVRQGVASVCVTWLVLPGWNLSWDTYAMEGTRLGPKTQSTILALSHRISPTLTLDAALEAGLNRQAPRYALNAGLIWRMGSLWNP